MEARRLMLNADYLVTSKTSTLETKWDEVSKLREKNANRIFMQPIHDEFQCSAYAWKYQVFGIEHN